MAKVYLAKIYFNGKRTSDVCRYGVDQLDEVSATDNSQYRVELLTPAQFHFATSLVGIDFDPHMLTARHQ